MELKEHVDTFEGWSPYAVIILDGIESFYILAFLSVY